MTNQPAGAPSPTPGPAAEVRGHIAIVPMLRVGLYAGYELAPLDGDVAARNLFNGGLRIRVTPPWPRGDFRIWAFTGFGRAFAHSSSYSVDIGQVQGRVSALNGGFFEVPLGIGAGYRLRRPLWLTGELGAKLGFAHTGSIYEDRVAELPSGALQALPHVGSDSLAIFLAIGVQWEP